MQGRAQRGDTLVEVILAIALISIVLVAAFNIIGASYRSAMFAKERIEAISLAQQQAERLLYLRDANAANDQPVFNNFPTGNNILDENISAVSCPATGCNNGIYRVIMQDALSLSIPPSEMRTYNIKVEWQRIGSSSPTDINETAIQLKLSNRDTSTIQQDCAVVESCF